MKVALVHDWLGSTRGGAEELLLELADLYPDAPIFCLTYEADTYPELASRTITPSWLQRLPRFVRERRSLLLWLAPQAIEGLRIEGYDVVISVSNSFAKGVRLPESTRHICYCQAPMRYVWDYWPDTLRERGTSWWRRFVLQILTHRLRLWDFYSSRGVDAWIANSRTTARRIAHYYQVPSHVIYPGIVDVSRYWQPTVRRQDYYVTLSTLTPYKKVDVAIRACIASKRHLVVIGDGPQAAELRELAAGHDNIVFTGRLSDEEVASTLQAARGLIFASEEDFGIAPIRAMAAGTPVIAYGRGGLTETVQAGVSGLFFNQPTAKSLVAALDDFEARRWDAAAVHASVRSYDRAVFRKQFMHAIEKLAGERRA